MKKYAGYYVYNKGYKGKKRKKRDDTIVIEDGIPAIISKEDFNIVMQKRRKNKKRPGSFKNPHTYLLSGLLVCKNCNGFYYGNKRTKQKDNKKYVYYKYVCQHRDKLNNCKAEELNKHEVEDLVINELKKVLLDSNNIDKIVNKINQKYSELYNSAKNDIEDTEKEIKDTQNKIGNLIKLVADGLYNDDIKQKLETLENDKTNLNIRLNRLKNISNNKTLNKNDILKVINFDIDKLNSNDRLGIKNLLNKYINKIIVDYPSLEIHFKFSSNIDNTIKQAKKNERDNSSVCVAPLVGLEPTTYRLTAERSTN